MPKFDFDLEDYLTIKANEMRANQFDGRPDYKYTLKLARDIADFFKHFTYKKGWRFAVYEDIERNMVRIYMQCDVVDATRSDAHLRHPWENEHREYEYDSIGRKEAVYIRSDYPERFNKTIAVPFSMEMGEMFETWLFHEICDAELHESMEFFKVNGKAPFFPHKRGSFETTTHPIWGWADQPVKQRTDIGYTSRVRRTQHSDHP